MIIKQPYPINLDSKLCSRCYICYSVCPFKAISLDQEKIPSIDIEKCMLCGICASACPSGIITLQEYNPGSLVKILEAKKANGNMSLVIACRGSTTPDCKSLDGLIDKNVENQIIMRVPCVGRLPLWFYLTALSHGAKNIVTVRCKHEFCRFDNGSLANFSRIYALKRMLGAMGYADSTLTIVERAKQVDYSTTDCVGCDKCVHVCPYKAISTGQFGTPSIDYLKCTGCGACTVVCPHLALEISGYECKHIAEIIENNSRQIKKGNAYPPAILVFCCQWAEFGNLDPRIESMVRPNLSIIEIPCFSKLDPINVIQALNQGYDGVLAVTCSDNDCKSKESRNTAEDNMTVLSAGLKIMGLESRFKVYKTSPRKVGDFNREVESFSNIISSLKREGVTGHE